MIPELPRRRSRRGARARRRARSRRAPPGAARRRAGARSGACRRSAPAAPAAACARVLLGFASSTCFRPSRIEVSAWPVSSCSSRASRARSSSCPSTTRRRESRATRSARSTATEARAANVSARRRSSSVKRGPARAGCGRRSRRSRGRRRSSGRTGPSGGPSGGRAPGRPRRPRASSRRARCAGARARGRSSSRRRETGPAQLVGAVARRPPRSAGRRPAGSAITTSSASISSPSRVAIRSSSGPSSVSPASALPTSVSDSSWREPARRRLVQPCVLDRDRGLGGEQRDELLVLGGEVLAALLLGQVQVPVGDAAEQDRHAEEGAHRRVVRREADRARVGGEVVQAERLRVADQDAEDPAAVRQVADPLVCLVVDTGRQEALERAAGAVDHAQRGVLRAGQLGGGLDDPLQDRVERELRRDRDSGVDRSAPAVFHGTRLSLPEIRNRAQWRHRCCRSRFR